MKAEVVKRNSAPATFGSFVDQIFENNLSRFFDDLPKGFSNSKVPVNIKETDKSYQIEVIAPGLDKKDFHLDTDDNRLTVSFEHKEEKKDEDKKTGWIKQEYKHQSFTRSFALDETVDAEKITASYNNGVLTLEVPKKEKVKKESRSIDIK
ncbi:Hsp20/alpha crystallin family protein [Chitinophaga silvatica]|uniref:Hsp20/alpha crystallin family protein n=1 Tax=Chitinophaga silvatica TaxID=2282649 RepID=A0A3E1Y5G4_9BACT|nr:Hsp20/alpha crystallin family protein [Chitinophaga silvatica]RFS19974.1 Hsp20/alpha crystallin family protein [Chitinophaga silvatica]